MKILIIGAVAAGTKAAAKLRRELPADAAVEVITAARDISYAGCGLPYYIGGVVDAKDKLMVNTPESFGRLTGVQVTTGMQALQLNAAEKQVKVKDLGSGEESVKSYDKLIIATGAVPVVPPIPGAELAGVFTLRTPDDADAIIAAAADAKRAVIIGGGYIGLEAAENLAAKGLRVSVVEMLPHIMPGFDADFAEFAENHLADEKIMVFTGDAVTELEGENGRVTAVRTGKRKFKADLVLLSAGIRPATDWLKGSGLEMNRGCLVTDAFMRTNLPDVYAAGDCALSENLVTGNPVWAPMGSIANLQGRIAARAIAGTALHGFRGVLGTAIVHLPGLDCAKTGLNAAAAKAAGFDAVSATLAADSKAHFMPGADTLIIRLTADRSSHKLLGAQVMGGYGTDRLIDIAVTAITMGACMEDLEDMDLAYAPPFATAMDAFTVAVNVMLDKLNGLLEGGTPEEAEKTEGWYKLDVGKSPATDGLPYLPVEKITGPIEGVPFDTPILLLCAKGKNSYLAQNRLKKLGYTHTFVLEGGVSLYPGRF